MVLHSGFSKRAVKAFETFVLPNIFRPRFYSLLRAPVNGN